MGASTELYKQQLWQKIGISSLDEFFNRFWEKWFSTDGPKTHCYLWPTNGKNGNVSAPYDNDLSKALGRITAKTNSDCFFQKICFIPVRDCQAEQVLIPGSKLEVLDSPWGHFTMLGLFEEDFNHINKNPQKNYSQTPDFIFIINQYIIS